MENNKELLSIIIPVYNVEKYVEKCLESVINQTYSNIEVIIVDDGSTDCSGNLCDKYASEYTFVTVYHKSNGGLSSARNYGIAKAKGTYIGFVDSDDWIAPNMYEVLMKNAINYKADICMCNYCLVYSENKQIARCIKEDQTAVYTGACAAKRLYAEFSAWNKIYTRRLFEKVQYPEKKLYEDARTTYRLAGLSNCVVVCPLALYYYRQRNSGIMGTFSCANYIDRVNVWNEIYDYEKDKFPVEELNKILLRKHKLVIELLKTLIAGRQFLKNKEVVKQLLDNLEKISWDNKDFSVKEKCIILFSKAYISICKC